MKYQIALLLTYIIISIPNSIYGNGLVQSLIGDREYNLARLELYKHYYEGDSLASQTILPIIAYTYQLQGQHLKAKELYRQSLQNSSLLDDSFTDSIKANLCYSLMDLHEYGTVYGLFGSIKSNVVIPVKRKFYILTVERDKTLDTTIFNPDEIASYREFSKTLKNPHFSKFLSAIIPGLGQFYSSHTIDGAQALMVVGAGIVYSAVSLQAYNQNDLGAGLPIVTVGATALFHYANILSGFRTAIYRNIKLKREYLSETGFDVPALNLSTRYISEKI